MSRIKLILAAVTMALVGLTAGAETPRCPAAKDMSGLPNFGCVTDTLFRGGQPASAGFQQLKNMGVGIVINFRDEQGETSNEKREVEALGMKYIGIPWNGFDKPSTDQVAQFLEFIHANPQAKVFVHCKRGADRTGVMVAAYRIAVEHMTVAAAVAEMHAFHYDQFLLPQLRRYVESFPTVLQADHRFSSYIAASSPQTATASAADQGTKQASAD